MALVPDTKSVAMWILGVAGWIGSWVFFAMWLVENDWGFVRGWVAAFTTCDFSTGLHLDLLVVSLMLVVLALFDRDTLGRGWTFAVIASLAISVSMSLAFYVVGHLRLKGRNLT